jgi:flagellar assembly protein FliH
MKLFRPHRFPPLGQFSAVGRPEGSSASEWQASLSAGFEQGRNEGYETGLESGRRDGYDAGLNEGLQQGRAEGRRETLVSFESLASPLEAMLKELKSVQEDYQSVLRKEVVDLVAKVARQVIRCELALQPTQLLALVDETLAAMPPVREGVDVYLNPGELQRILEVDPERAEHWALIPDPRLEPGECRVNAGDHEADAGCRQRLAACIEQVSAQLLDEADEVTKIGSVRRAA